MNIVYTKDTVTMSRMCSLTEEMYSVTVDRTRYDRWSSKLDLIQNVFPELSDNEREFMISGMTPWEWEELMLEERYE